MADKYQNLKARIPSAVGRLLYEISWEGNAKKGYREGGRGRENVLTAETLQILDFLPRSEFLGAVIQNMHGADKARQALLSEVETLDVQVLPPEIALAPSARTRKGRALVQPDGHLDGRSAYCLIEAKRIRSSSFQRKQLAREVVAAVKTASNREPLVALFLGHPPPIRVKTCGDLSIEEAIELHLPTTIEHEVESFAFSIDEVRALIPEIVCWITWDEIGQVVAKQAESFRCESESVENAVHRMAAKMNRILDWHS